MYLRHRSACGVPIPHLINIEQSDNAVRAEVDELWGNCAMSAWASAWTTSERRCARLSQSHRVDQARHYHPSIGRAFWHERHFINWVSWSFTGRGCEYGPGLDA